MKKFLRSKCIMKIKNCFDNVLSSKYFNFYVDNFIVDSSKILIVAKHDKIPYYTPFVPTGCHFKSETLKIIGFSVVFPKGFSKSMLLYFMYRLNLDKELIKAIQTSDMSVLSNGVKSNMMSSINKLSLDYKERLLIGSKDLQRV